MPSSEVLTRAFPWRLSAIEALIEASQPRNDNAQRLREIAGELDRAAALYGRARSALTYAAFAELLRTAAMLVQWRTAMVNADAEADRFLKAAFARHRQWLSEYASKPVSAEVFAGAPEILTIRTVEEIAEVCRRLATIPLPVVFSSEEPLGVPTHDNAEFQARAVPAELTVAFLTFHIDGKPAEKIHFLEPGKVHDLELEVRVSRWPQAAQILELRPVTIELPSSFEFTVFELKRPAGDPPFRLRQRGRALLKAPQGLNAQPFEFKYAAAFKPDQAEQPIGVIGQRTLLLEGIDLTQNPIAGYKGVDAKLLKIRNRLRTLPLIGTDLDNVLTVLIPLSQLAARIIQDTLFEDVTSEADFQVEARNELRRHPRLAADLEEHPHAAGGITDLSYRGIRIELKFENKALMTLQSCERFTAQTASYVIATGKRVGILCVLDNSPKASHAFPAEDGIGILTRTAGDAEIQIVTVLLQGRIPLPSSLSR